jgi:micrococcal nuclease
VKLSRIFLLLFLLGCGGLPDTGRAMSAGPELPAANTEGGERAAVLFVADGDTVKVRLRQKGEWVRLLRIDTPERDEEGYGESREALQSLVGERTVELVYEKPGRPERDRHERLLAYLYFEGRNVNVEMVRLGWSPFWTRYGAGRFAPSFREAEREARTRGRGLWRDHR